MNAPGIKVLRPLAGGGGEATVELVEIEDRRLVLKRQSPRHAAAERLFQRTLAGAGLPCLEVMDHPALRPDQILLEYVEDSATLGGSPTPAACSAWGAAIAGLHAIRPGGFLTLNTVGAIVEDDWPTFLRRAVETGLETQRRRADGLPKPLLDCVALKLAELTEFEDDVFAVAHGDLHLNNALVRGGKVVLFDKSHRLWTAPPVFDLALVWSEGFPGARYVENQARAGDTDRLAAFMAGYGPLPQVEWLDHFVLLHALDRYPSPFVPDHRSIVEAALARR